MTYLPFVYLILLSPEQYYTNNLRIQNGYQPIPFDYARKFDVKDKIQQPVVYLPYVLLPPLKNFEDSPKDNNAEGAESGAGVESEGNMDDDINKGNDTLSNKDTSLNSTESSTPKYKPVGWSLLVQNCPDGFLADENGNCQKGITKGVKEFELDRKKRATTQQQNPNGRMIFKLSKKISVRNKRSTEEKKLSYADIVKYGRRGPPSHTREIPTAATTSKPPTLPTTTAKTTTQAGGSRQSTAASLPPGIPLPSTGTPSNPTKNQPYAKPGDNWKMTATPSTTRKTSSIPDYELKGSSAPSKPSTGKESSLFINSEAAQSDKKSLNINRRRRDPIEKFREENLSYGNMPRYRGIRPLSRRKVLPVESVTSKKPTEYNASEQLAVLSHSAGIPVSADKSVAPSSAAMPSTTGKTSVPNNESKIKTKPVPTVSSVDGKPCQSSSEKPKSPDAPQENQTAIPDKSPQATTRPPYLYLVTTLCENGYIKDENGNCVKTVKRKNQDKWSAKLERKRRDTDRLKLLKEILDAEDRIIDKRNPQQRFYYRLNKQLENDTRKIEAAFTRSNPTLPTEKTPDKNAASDGFGYISKECNKLVPGLVSDGAGGCTKSVKPKEKILQLERRKRQARTAYINFIDHPNNVLRKNNFTIRITLKGFNKNRLNFTGENREKPYDDGNKAVADNGFGVTSSKCDNLVPGLVHDGVGGCTRAVTTIRKRSKFSFVLKNVENTQPLIDVEYESPEPELVNTNDNEDPDADII